MGYARTNVRQSPDNQASAPTLGDRNRTAGFLVIGGSREYPDQDRMPTKATFERDEGAVTRVVAERIPVDLVDAGRFRAEPLELESRIHDHARRQPEDCKLCVRIRRSPSFGAEGFEEEQDCKQGHASAAKEQTHKSDDYHEAND